MDRSIAEMMIVLFRGKIIALNRKILLHASSEKRRRYLVKIVVEFVDFILVEMKAMGLFAELEEAEDAKSEDAAEPEARVITEEDVERFRNEELAQLDDATYFKEHLE